ncbi:helix-turn-helix transcriptional regulator [Nocardia suismassiliense]|uniref:helix-turn-helix transcriptional regulator n=1 Tax=Nocardia suismassiliense TaxID=2077092 RepID=UPI000D1F15E4|nr:helix-turn-helix transcriptional regulator [Nocardia suismassiliense]
MLYGRIEELAVIDRLLSQAKAGASGALLLRGQPGIGKTALLDYAAATDGMRVLRGTGVESEAELPFAGLHMLLGRCLDRIEALPEPQRRALEGAFGLVSVPSTERLLVGLAVLSLLAELAEETPVLCVIDDAQWLDRASAEALVFAARRLHAEGVAVLFAARDGETAFSAPGLPELTVTGLAQTDAVDLLDRHGNELTPTVRFRVLTEACGNPLALLELPAAFAVELSGARRPLALPLTTRLQAAFYGQVSKLPEATRTLLLVAAEDTGDLDLVLRSAALLGFGLADLVPAEQAGLIRIADHMVTFRHPLVRAAVSQGAPVSGRLAVHRTLAAALDGSNDIDRRAWHLAAAATGPSEGVAAVLENTAARAGRRNGHAAAAAAYERASQLTADPAARSRRLTLAAEAANEMGDFDRARALAESVPEDGAGMVLRARLLALRAAADFGTGALRSAHALLCTGIDLIVAEDDPSAQSRLTEMIFLAWHISWQSGDSVLLDRTAERLATLSLPAADPLAPVCQLLIWLTRLPLGRPVTDLPPLPEVAAAARRIRADDLRGIILTGSASLAAGADTESNELAASVAALLRNHGRIGLLSPALTYLATTQLFFGRYADAQANATEAAQIALDTGQPGWHAQANSILVNLAALQGDEQACRSAAEAGFGTANGSALGSPGVQWGLSLLDLGYGRAEAALCRLEEVVRNAMPYRLPVIRCTPDLVEAAVRIGEPDRAAAAFARFTGWAAHAGQPWIDALVQRCLALLATDDAADAHYLAALELHDQARPVERARTQLLYGEWLRRGRRTIEARTHLRAAVQTFDRLGATPWADRARSELDASGAAVPTSRPPGVLAALTPQELQIVRLAGRGMSNRDIAAQLFLSPRTIGHHLYKAYPKLGVASRTELSALPLFD